MKTKFYIPRAAVLAALSAVILWGGSQSVDAGTMTYVASGTTNGLSTSAQAVITLSNGTVLIELTNTLNVDITAMGQVLTGITVSYAGGLKPTSIISSSGSLIKVDKTTGSVTQVGSNPQSINAVNGSEGWNLSSSGFLSVFGSGGPDYGLLDYQATYASSNGSIAGNPPHNPFTNTTDSFTLNAPGITSTTSIKSVIFQFGTSVGSDTATGTLVPNPVPEPTSLALWSAALVTMGYRRLRTKTINSNGKAISS